MAGAFKVAAVAFAAVGAVAVGVGIKVNELGAQYEAMDAKAKTVFGGSLGTVKKWAAANAAAMGLTAREATGLAANFADLLIPMGFTRDQAAAMSTDVVGLSGALSEWSGGQKTAAEVSDILAKAMLGEREGLKSLGISITEADVKQQMLKDGTSELTGAALEQAKAMATQTLIMAKSTDAQAAYEKGTAKGIRAQNEMKAKLNEVKETLVKALYPILQTVTKFIADNLPAAIKTAGDIWNWLSKNVMPAAVNIFKVIVEVVKTLAPVFKQIFHTIGDIITGFVRTFQAVVGAVQTVVARVKSAITSISTVMNNVGSAIRTAWNNLLGFFGGLPGRVGNAVSGMWNSIASGFKSVINTVIGWWNRLGFQVPSINLGPLGQFGGFWIGTPDIPYLHAGGMVPGSGDVAAVLQGGEMVAPTKFVDKWTALLNALITETGDGSREVVRVLVLATDRTTEAMRQASVTLVAAVQGATTAIKTSLTAITTSLTAITTSLTAIKTSMTATTTSLTAIKTSLTAIKTSIDKGISSIVSAIRSILRSVASSTSAAITQATTATAAPVTNAAVTDIYQQAMAHMRWSASQSPGGVDYWAELLSLNPGGYTKAQFHQKYPWADPAAMTKWFMWTEGKGADWQSGYGAWASKTSGEFAVLHAGGIVPGASGSDVPTMLQAGERVIPRKYAGQGGGITIHFNGPVFADEVFIDEFTRKIAMRLRTVSA